MESRKIFCSVTEQSLDLQTLVDFVSSPCAGATSTFIGTTRNTFQGKTVVRLEYEAYHGMAEKEMNKICDTIFKKWKIIGIAISHRIGVVPVGESSIIIAVSSAHRKDSLEACQYAIDTVKETVPVWKKEIYENGNSEWKENCEGCTKKHGQH